jgi:hypothetical protein
MTAHPPTPFFGSFLRAYQQLFPQKLCARILATQGPRGAGCPKLSLYRWVMALVYHALAGSGTFAAHVYMLTGKVISDSALSQRKASVGREMLAALLPAVLRPLADAARHPGAFHHGLRLCAIDGLRFNLRNTAAINAAARKVKCSKGGALPAFAHLVSVVLVELGTHLPLAAALGWKAQGELSLVRELFGSVPRRSLLLADRLYGAPWLLWALLPHLQAQESHCLFRVKANIKVRVRRHLADGSQLICAPARDPQSRRLEGHVLLREITALITVAGSAAPLRIRLWTTLLDESEHPAEELVKLYAQRWEQELFFRELKTHVQGTHGLLKSLRPESAAQDVLALLLAAALLASQRAAVAQSADVPVLRISLAQVLSATVALSEVLETAGNLLSRAQQIKLAARTLERLRQTALIPQRKPRRCQRALRQPVRDWPKMRHPTSLPLVRSITIQRANP